MKHLLLLLIFSFFHFLFSEEILEKLVNEAFEKNPEISKIEFQIKALQEKEIFTQIQYNPMLAIEYSNVPYDTWKLDENPMSGIQLKLTQAIPFPKKNSKRKAVVESEGKIKKWELAEYKLQLKDSIKKAYYQLSLTRELKSLSLKHIALLETLIEAIINKYEAGKSSQSDILHMTLMKEKLLDDLDDFEQKESEIQATINSVLSRDVNTNISTNRIELNQNIEQDFDALLKKVISNRPLLKKIEESSKKNRLSFISAKQERLPDITFWAGYRIRKDIGGMKNVDFASIGFSIPIPLDLKGITQAKMNNSKFMEDAEAENYTNVFNTISDMLFTAISGLKRAENKIDNYNKNLVPNAEKVFQAELHSYETGQANFTDLYQAQLQLLQFERILLESEYKYKMYETTIETLTGEKS